MKDSLKSIAESDQKILDKMQEQLKHDCRAFGAIRALNVLKHAAQNNGILTPELQMIINAVSLLTDSKDFYGEKMMPMMKNMKCPRCKWEGTEDELKPVQPKGDHEDGAETFTLYTCPKCGEHKLIER